MRARNGVPTSVAACIALAVCAAQPSPSQVVLEGRVLDDVSGRRLSGAQVMLLDRYNKTVGFAVTDDSGYFRFTESHNGWYRLDVKAVGYMRALTPFLSWTVDRSYAGLEVWLAPNAVLLAPLEIVALSPLRTSPILENVDHRRTRGFGVQINRQAIEARKPANISDMLLELPGVYAARRGSGASGRALYMGRALAGPGGGECPVQIFLDGMPATRDHPGGDVFVDDLVSPLDIEVVEVFRGLGSIPPEFLTLEARCGVIAIWTKRFMEARP